MTDDEAIKQLRYVIKTYPGYHMEAAMRHAADRLEELTQGMDCPGASDSSREWAGDPAQWLAPPNTVRVRVAVAVDDIGRVGAWPISEDYDESAAMYEAQSRVAPLVDHFILVADRPVPAVPEVPARVEEKS